MSASDDDFIDVAATVAGAPVSPFGGGGAFGDGNDALRALSGDDGGATSASTSRQSPPPVAASASAPPAPRHHSRRGGWFSSLFGGGGAFPAAVQAARSRTVRREKEREIPEWKKREGGKPWKKNFAVLSTLSLSHRPLSFYNPPSPLSLSPSLPATGHRPPGPLVSWSLFRRGEKKTRERGERKRKRDASKKPLDARFKKKN